MTINQRIESRGIRCLDCRELDLSTYPEQARTGFGWCPAHELPHFVSVSMARNCLDYSAAPVEEAKARAGLIEETAVLFWRRK
jgi:hypothetical protein